MSTRFYWLLYTPLGDAVFGDGKSGNEICCSAREWTENPATVIDYLRAHPDEIAIIDKYGHRWTCGAFLCYLEDPRDKDVLEREDGVHIVVAADAESVLARCRAPGAEPRCWCARPAIRVGRRNGDGKYCEALCVNHAGPDDPNIGSQVP